MQVIGLCRFSYPGEGGFQVEHDNLAERIAYLYADARMEDRFRQFEYVSLPALRNQTDPDFTLVVVIGDQMPARWRNRLEHLLSDMPQAIVRAYPPGPHRTVMQTAINDAKKDPERPCLQFRHDDDDAVAVDFVERLRGVALDCAGLVATNRLVGFDFNRGYSAEAGPDGIRAVENVMPLYGVALGMAVRGGVRQTIMNFGHKKLNRFMPVVSLTDSPMFVRGHNPFNDSRQKDGVATPNMKLLDAETRALFKDRFCIDEETVRRMFAGSA